jgi:GR25 family glycosyltransferase involved in LPS biosynthesis
MKIKCINLKKIKQINYTEFKPTNLKEKQEIIFYSNSDIFIQFKIYIKFIDSFEVYQNNLLKYTHSINFNEFLFASDLKSNQPIRFVFKSLDYCGRIHIKNLVKLEYPIEQMVQIVWDKVFIINLARRPERKNLMVTQLESAGITDYEFVNAVDGQDSKIVKKYEQAKTKGSQIITPGHYACLFSHILTIKLALTRGYSSVMILEDDIFFCSGFLDKIAQIKVPEQYDMVYLGGLIYKKKIFLNSWAKTDKIMGAYAYILSKSMYKILIDQLKKTLEYIDLFYAVHIQPNYKVYLLNDLVLTTIDSTDTSAKSKKLVQMLKLIQ